MSDYHRTERFNAEVAAEFLGEQWVVRASDYDALVLRIAELEAESASQKDVIDMLAQPKAEIEAERLCWVRGLTAVCADVAELDREIVLEIGKLRGES